MNQYSSFQFQNITLSNDTTPLDILESLLADNTETKPPIDLEARQSIGENSNINYPESNAETPNNKILLFNTGLENSFRNPYFV